MPVVLAIDPGSTSLKLGVYESDGERNEERWAESRPCPWPDLGAGGRDACLALLRAALADRGRAGIEVVASRGGLLAPGPGGIMAIDEELLADLAAARYGAHASNLGPPAAVQVALELGVPAVIVDPPTTDEFTPESRISGVPGVPRRSRFHALNLRARARLAARELGLDPARCRLAMAHLGGGTSVVAYRDGMFIDSTDALLGEGPFSPSRAGTVPTAGVIDLVERLGRSGTESLLASGSGFAGLAGSADLKQLATAGGPELAAITAAYRWQVVKALGGMWAVLGGADAIVLTGAVLGWSALAADLQAQLAPLGKVLTYPGEGELEVLAAGGALSLLKPGLVHRYRPDR
jgi:butyrate kinase